MKRLLLVMAFLFLAFASFSQFTYKIKADSVKITRDSCTAELILENSTKSTKGFLYNKGNGRTEFRQGSVKVNDTTYIIGGDTLRIPVVVSSHSISGLAPAVATNTINNLNYAQNWQWNSLASGNGLSLTSSSTAAAANNQKLLNVSLTGVNANSNQASYAAYIENLHTGTNANNVGLFVQATGPNNNSAIYAKASGGVSNTVGFFEGAAGSPIIGLLQPTSSSNAVMTFTVASLGTWSIGHRGTTSDFVFNASQFFSGVDALKLSHSTGNMGVGHGSGTTAKLQIAAGGASANNAPLKFTSGTNLTTPENGAVEFDGTNYFVTSGSTRYTLAKTLTATSTLNFGSTSAQNSSDLTITVTGAADGDAVSLGVPNAAINANSSYSAWVSASNTITVRFNNYSSGAIDPASATFRVTVSKY